MIQSVQRAAQILRVLATGAPRLGVTEIAERVGLAKATVYGLLRTLEQEELVQQDTETGKYRLGPALLELGNAFLDNNELRARSLLWAESLASRAREAVRVGVLNGPNVLVVHHVFRPDNTVQLLEVGATIPWHACAMGKAIVGQLDASEVKLLAAGDLVRLTGRTVTAPAALDRELKRARREGYAVDDQEAILGEAGIASPVFDHHGAAVGSIGITGPVERVLPDGPDAEMVAAVREAARNLSRELGAGRVSARGVSG